MRSRLLWLSALLFPVMLRAQSIRGVVVDQGNQPVSGVVVVLLDSASVESSRALSNEAGEFRLSATRAGSYRLRTMRIGFRPFTSSAFAVSSGTNAVPRVVLSNVQLALDTMKVVAQNVCRVDRDSAASTFAVWEQVRTALHATQLTGAARTVNTTALNFERTLDRMGRNVLAQITTVNTHLASQPWRSLSPDSLRRGGYVVNNGTDATIYYAPSIEVLLSDVFLEDHCFHLKSGKDKSQLGIAFSPAPTRKKTAELSGTLWLDRKTARLRRLEFGYENILAEQQAESGGDMAFVAMRDGSWAISHWNIRMPVLVRAVRAQSLGGDQLTISEIHVSGGELALAVRGADTLWSQPPLVLSGDVVDSVSNRSIAGAVAQLSGTALQGTTDAKGHFTITGVLPGEYTLDVRTPSLDSVSAAHQTALTFTDGKTAPRIRVPSAAQIMATVCSDARMEVQGIVAGSIRSRAGTALPATLRVVAEWTENVAASASASETTGRTRWRVVQPGARGGYRFCGLPINTNVVVQLEVKGENAGNSEPVTVRLTPATRVVRADLSLDQAITRGAVLAGVVMTDSARTPVADVEVLLPELSKHTVTDERGEFRLRDIPAGTHRVVIRRVGFGPVDSPIEFLANQTVDRRVYLSRVTVVDSVVITADRPERWRALFDENRKLGRGQFLTREDLAKKEGQTISSVMAELRGTYVHVGTSTNAWMTSNRRGSVLDEFHPIRSDSLRGAPWGCYADVWLDNALMFSGKPREPLFDLNQISPDRIEAIEYYTSTMQVPINYTSHRNCGVLVLHLRR